MIVMNSEIKKIVMKYKGKKSALISLLQEIQEKQGYLSKDTISGLGKELKISESEIYGVATFYSQFKFKKPGKHQVKVCLGTACHVRGGHDLMRNVERQLDIKHGEKTTDSQFSLERVACMGCCALAPVLVVDKDIYGKTTSTKVKQILNKYKNNGGD